MKIHGVNPYVLVSAERASELKPGWRKPVPVLVRINGKPEEPWSINMMPVGDGSFRLYLHGAVRKASGSGVGDRVRVEVRLDSAYKKRASASGAVMVQICASRESGGEEELGEANSEPKERSSSLFCGIEICRGPRT